VASDEEVIDHRFRKLRVVDHIDAIPDIVVFLIVNDDLGVVTLLPLVFLELNRKVVTL
jgi:hypothetical protein